MKRYSPTFPMLACLVCLLFGLSPAMASAQAGKILFARGEVSIVGNDGQQRVGDAGEAVHEGDHILTGERSMAQVRLSDGALISLRSHSDYQIKVQDEGLLEQAGKMFQGWMRSVTGSIGKSRPEGVEQETPVATIGIRGTAYQVIHIPEGGLPGYEDTAPGTYIYLEEGRLEADTRGGTRFVDPGQVVFIDAAGGGPRLAPDKKPLFMGFGDMVEKKDEKEIRQLLGSYEDELDDDQLLNDTLEEEFDPSSKSVAVGNYVPDGFIQGLRSGGDALKVSGTGSGRIVTGMAYADDTGAVHVLQGNAADTPGNRGFHTLASGAEINWGVWAEGTYSAEIVDPVDGTSTPNTTGQSWHYIVGNYARSLSEVQTMTGQFNYNYKGGTTLASINSGFTTTIDSSSRLQVDFGNNGIIVDLVIGGSAVGGSGSFSQFYDSSTGISFSSGGSDTGTIYGAFTGKGAEGIISELNYYDGLNDTYHGTAAFEQGGETTIAN